MIIIDEKYKDLLHTQQPEPVLVSMPHLQLRSKEKVCGSRQLVAIALVVASSTPLVQPEFGFESKTSQCWEFAAEGIRMICPAADFGCQVPMTPQQKFKPL